MRSPPVLGSVPSPPSTVSSGVSGCVCAHPHLRQLHDGPHEADEFACDSDDEQRLRFHPRGQATIAPTRALFGACGDFDHGGRLLTAPSSELLTRPGLVSVVPRRFNE
jgi:hypothetical protein